jgi:hypothetical protein
MKFFVIVLKYMWKIAEARAGAAQKWTGSATLVIFYILETLSTEAVHTVLACWMYCNKLEIVSNC